MDVRQSAAIYLKNLATTHWHRVDGALPLLEQEKQTIRGSVLAAMMHSPTLIRYFQPFLRLNNFFYFKSNVDRIPTIQPKPSQLWLFL
jgi:hypothetical protein